MKKEEYLKLVKGKDKEKNILKNALISFLIGGLLGSIFHLLTYILVNTCNMSSSFACGIVLFIYITLAIILTGMGIFDKLISKYKFGLIIPITGFAHSVASCLLEYKRDGFITGIGANMFKLAGSVILYGSVAGVSFAILRVIING